jgi:hypothetical protein
MVAKICKKNGMTFGFRSTNEQIEQHQLFPLFLEANQLSGSFILTLSYFQK